MKKFFLFSALLCICLMNRISAQTINSNYTLPGYTLSLPAQVAPNEVNNSLFFSVDARDVNNVHSILLVRTDLLGNVLNSILTPSISPLHQMIETRDGGVILYGYGVGGVSPSLRAIKFDNTLTQVWATNMPITAPTNNMSFTHLDIQSIYYPNLNEEHYFFIATTGVGALDPNYASFENAFVAGRLRENGQVQWKNLYVDQNKASSPYDTWENTNSITPIPNGSTWHFVISGTRDDFDPMTWASPRRLSFIRIDDNGNVVTPYRAITTYSNTPAMPDVVWDPYKSSVVATFIEAPQPAAIALNTASVIGFLRMNSALVPNIGRHYYLNYENYGLGITVSSDRNYVISATLLGGQLPSTPSFFKISSNTFNPMWMKMYNMFAGTISSEAHRMNNLDFNYLMGTNMNGVKLLKTDPMGVTCGSFEKAPFMEAFTPVPTNFTYKKIAHQPFTQTTYPYQPVVITEADCVHPTVNPDYFRQAGSGESEAEQMKLTNVPTSMNVSIAPTLLNSNGEQMKCTIMSPEAGMVEITVVNAVGQIVYKRSETVTPGTNIFNVDVTALMPGMSIVRVTQGSKVINTTKVTLY